MSAQRSFSSCPSSSSSAFDSCTGRLTTNARTKAVMKPFFLLRRQVTGCCAAAPPRRHSPAPVWYRCSRAGKRPRRCAGTSSREREREREREKSLPAPAHADTALGGAVVRFFEYAIVYKLMALLLGSLNIAVAGSGGTTSVSAHAPHDSRHAPRPRPRGARPARR